MSGAGSRTVGHPIDVATGVMTTDETDFAIPSRCELSLERYYSTAMPALPGALFGPGWRCEYEVTLRKDLEGYTLITAGGDAITFDEAARLPGETLVIENQSAFHELRREGGWFIVAQWDEDGLVARYWFREHEGTSALEAERFEDTPGQFRLVERDGAGRITRVTESHGHRQIHWAYGDHGRVVSVTLVAGDEQRVMATYEYNATGRLSAAYDVVGVPSVYEYDAAGRMVRENTRDEGRFEFAYDARGRCVYTSGIDGYDRQRLTYFVEGHKTAVEDARGYTWVYEWRSDGQVERVISPLGNFNVTTYDEKGRIASRIDGEKHETRFAYDERGNRCRVEPPDGTAEAFTYDARRQAVERVDRCGAAWRWEYDEAGREVAEVDPLGYRWSRAYDARGDLVSISDPLGRKQMFQYDRHGDLVGLLQPAVGAVALKRDLAGYVVNEVDEVGLISRVERDARGLPLRVHLPEGTTYSYAHDVAGNLRELVTPEGYRTIYRYGPCRRPLRVEQPDNTAIRFVWGAVPGQLEAVLNEADESYRYEYDADGRVEYEVDFGGFGRRYEYDRAGRSTREGADDGSFMVSEWDAVGRITHQIFSDGATRSFEYDGEGRLVRASNESGDTNFERDALGHVVRETQCDFVVESRYDAAGQRVGCRPDQGTEVLYEFDHRGLMSEISVTGAPGEGLPWRSSFEYDRVGRRTVRNLPGELSIRWSHHPTGLLDTRSVQHRGGITHSVQHYWKRYDKLSAMRDSSEGETQFEHDARGYPTLALHPDGQTQHRAHDARGNLFETPTLEDRQYGAGGTLHRARAATYQYGVGGELIEKQTSRGERWRYEWNTLKELIAVERPDGRRVEFRYDAVGRRVEKRFDGRVTRYGWDGDDMIVEQKEGAAPVQWVFGEDTFTPLARMQGAVRHGVVADHVGAPVGFYDESGRLAWRMQLDLYGVASTEGDAGLCGWRWPGQWADQETGLYYNRFRYYDPLAGSYISKDPVGLLGGLPPYGYVTDPLFWVDPFGLSRESTSTHITYIGTDRATGLPYIGYASMPGNHPGRDVLAYRYSGAFDRFQTAPAVVFSAYGDKATARGLEQRHFERFGGLKGTANRQSPVGRRNSRRTEYLNAADRHLKKRRRRRGKC